MIISSYCSPSVLWYKIRYDEFVDHCREQESKANIDINNKGFADLVFDDLMLNFGKMLSYIWMIGIKYSLAFAVNGDDSY